MSIYSQDIEAIAIVYTKDSTGIEVPTNIMRAFVVLSFIAVASAGRLGYNYQPGFSGSDQNAVGSFAPLSGIGSGIGSGLNSFGFGGSSGSGVNSGELFAPASGSGSGIEISSGGLGFNSIGSGFGNGGNSGIGGGSTGTGSGIGSVGSYGLGGGPTIDGGLNKEYYTYSAPEEDFNDGQASQQIASAIKKNLRVLFIKAPENNAIQNAALQLAKKGSEDKTLIYVLSKQPDLSELTNQVQKISNSVRQKPEVRFIKYRTPQDAINAQQSIQQQYDALGGSTHASNEGVAPVLNYASPSEYRPSSVGNVIDLGSSGSASSSIGSIARGKMISYLPPIVY